MKIITYRDLKPKDGLLPLMEQAFGWPFNEHEFNRFVRIDPRLKDGSVGFCALIGSKIVSYVGVMDLATRTSDGGPEYVGGIYGVATLPGYTRQGLSRALFNAAHEYFKDKDYRFSFLNTSPTLVAYSLYRKLGYSDVVYYPSTYKISEAKKATSIKDQAASKLDLDKVLTLYGKYVKGRTGFVARDKSYLKMLVKDKRLLRKGTVLREKGYVVFRKERYSTRIQEVIALDSEETANLIEAVEKKSRGVICARAVLDKTLLRIYRSRGYAVLTGGHGVLMVKPLRDDTSFRSLYGGAFFQTELDHF